jgi:hypothetical protein
VRSITYGIVVEDALLDAGHRRGARPVALHWAVGIGTHRRRAGRRERPLRLTGDARHSPGDAAAYAQKRLDAKQHEQERQ